MIELPDPVTAGSLKDTIAVFCGHGHNFELGLTYVDHGPDWIEYKVPWKVELTEPIDPTLICKSVIFSSLDASCALLPYVVSGSMMVCPTLELRVDHLRNPAPRSDLLVRAYSLKLTSDLSFTRAIAHEGRLDDAVSYANGTFMVVGGKS